MRAKVMFTALPLMMVAAGAWAAHSEPNRRYEDPRYQVEEVRKLAHEVEDRSRVVHRLAERWAHHRDVREERALVRLHELENRARHFHRQVERYGQSFGHTARDFHELRRAYSRAAFALHDLHAFRRIAREFDRLSDAMYDLEMYAEDLLGRARPAHRRYRDWDGDSDSDSDSDRYRPRRSHRHPRVVLPRVRVSWDWLDH